MKSTLGWILLAVSAIGNVCLIGCRYLDETTPVPSESTQKICSIAKTFHIDTSGKTDAMILDDILLRLENTSQYSGKYLSEKDIKLIKIYLACDKATQDVIFEQEYFLKMLQGKKLIILPADQTPAAQK